MKRLWELDAARGLMLVLMTITHVPSRFTDPVGQPFGFVSAAEGFVLLSAFVSGLVYSRIGYERGVDLMRRAFWRRALKIYLIQAALLMFLFTVITYLGLKVDHPEVREMVKYYLAHPVDAPIYSLLLVYQPAFLDILPLYILFMLLSPWVIAFAMRHGWQWPMALSATLWAVSQFGATEWLYQVFANGRLHVPVPYGETGSFDTFSWQFLWFTGMWLGASRNAPNAQPIVFPRWLLNAAIVVAVICFCWRHFGPTGQAPFGTDAAMNMLFDKWRLGPLRLVNLAALCIVAIRFGPALLARLPRARWLEAMGSASLPVFCAHLVAVFLVLTFIGRNNAAMSWWLDVLLLAVVFCGLYAVARGVLARERRAQRTPGLAPAGAAGLQVRPARVAVRPAESRPD